MRSLREFLRRVKAAKTDIAGIADWVVPVVIIGTLGEDQELVHTFADKNISVAPDLVPSAWGRIIGGGCHETSSANYEQIPIPEGADALYVTAVWNDSGAAGSFQLSYDGVTPVFEWRNMGSGTGINAGSLPRAYWNQLFVKGSGGGWKFYYIAVKLRERG